MLALMPVADLLDALPTGDGVVARHALDDHYRKVQSRLMGRGRSPPATLATAADDSVDGP